DVDVRGGAHDVLTHPDHPGRGLVLGELREHAGQGEDGGGEDDGDDPGHVDLDRDVGGGTAVHPPSDHPPGVLDRDPTLRLFDVDDRGDDQRGHQQEPDDVGDRV